MVTPPIRVPPGGRSRRSGAGRCSARAPAGGLSGWAARLGRDAGDPDVLYRGVIAWTRLYGFVALEIEGAFTSMGIDADAMYRREVEALLAL